MRDRLGMSNKHPFEQNEAGDYLPAGHPNEDIDEVGQSAQLARFPDVCAFPDCELVPIVGIDRRFVCQYHVEWAMTPMRDLLQIVRENFGD